MNNENLKFNVFVGSMVLLFLLSLLMAFLMFVGAARLGVAVLWIAVILSFTFNVITGFLGGKGGSVHDH